MSASTLLHGNIYMYVGIYMCVYMTFEVNDSENDHNAMWANSEPSCS